MTPDEIQKDKAICEAATGGPWEVDDSEDSEEGVHPCPRVFGKRYRRDLKDGGGTALPIIVDGAWAPDAIFIASSRTRWPLYIAEVERLQEGIRQMLLDSRASALTVTVGHRLLNGLAWDDKEAGRG